MILLHSDSELINYLSIWKDSVSADVSRKVAKGGQKCYTHTKTISLQSSHISATYENSVLHRHCICNIYVAPHIPALPNASSYLGAESILEGYRNVGVRSGRGHILRILAADFLLQNLIQNHHHVNHYIVSVYGSPAKSLHLNQPGDPMQNRKEHTKLGFIYFLVCAYTPTACWLV